MFLNALLDLEVNKSNNRYIDTDFVDKTNSNLIYDRNVSNYGSDMEDNNTNTVTKYCCESSEDADDSDSCYSFTKDDNKTQADTVFAHIGVIMDYCKDTLKNRVNDENYEAVYECFSGVSFYIDRVTNNKTGIFPISQDTISRDIIHNMYTIYNFSDNILNYLLYVSPDNLIYDIRKEIEERKKHCEHCISNKIYKHEFYFSYQDQLDHINSSINKLKTLLKVI